MALTFGKAAKSQPNDISVTLCDGQSYNLFIKSSTTCAAVCVKIRDAVRSKRLPATA